MGRLVTVRWSPPASTQDRIGSHPVRHSGWRRSCAAGGGPSRWPCQTLIPKSSARCGGASPSDATYALPVTLIIGMSKPEGIYLSVDYRVTNPRTREIINNTSIKSLTIHYPPADNVGPRVLLAFTGLAELPDGTPTLTWIRETLRGESEVIDQSMSHLRRRLNRDIAPLGSPLIINLLVLERYRRLLGGFTNVRIPLPGENPVMPGFRYIMNQLLGWSIFANGSGAQRLVKDGHFDRLQPHLGIVPREPMNHLKLLASMNRRVAAKDGTVSPFCQVSFIPSGTRFGPTSHAFTERGETVPFEMPLILFGIDTTEWTREIRRNLDAIRIGEISKVPEISNEKRNEQIKRRP
jgi:hypothetical protein